MPSLGEFERLFLLEFFVDYVTIQNASFDHSQSTLCVSFQFLHYPVMRVCEEKFTPKPNPVLTEDSKIVYKKGKSCLFSIHSDENNKISSRFNLIIAVCQQVKDCKDRCQCLVGQAAVDLGDSFLSLLQATADSTLESKEGEKYDLFPLKDKFKRTVGTVAAFARLSHFGKIIITQFQLAAEDNMNYMFKGTDAKKLFKEDPMMNFPIIENEPKPVETPMLKRCQTFPQDHSPFDKKEKRKKPSCDISSSSNSITHPHSSGPQDKMDGPQLARNWIIEIIDDKHPYGSSDSSSDNIFRDSFHSFHTKDSKHQKRTANNITPSESMSSTYDSNDTNSYDYDSNYGSWGKAVRIPKDGLVDKKEDENYKEIEAEINGHSITIRVVKKSRKEKIKLPSLSCCPLPDPPICPNAPKLRLCDCDYPLPPELMSPRCPTQCCLLGSTENIALLSNQFQQQNHLTSVGTKIANEIQSSPNTNTTALSSSQEQMNNIMPPPVCPREDCPLGLYSPSPPPDPLELDAGCVAMRGDQVFFQMTNRPAGEPVNEKEKKLAGSVYYTVGATDGGKETMRNFVQITPQGPTESLCNDKGVEGPVSGIPLNNKQDMFLLKVLQQNYSESAKCKLEMELRTPKEKELKPQSNTIDTQCVAADFPPIERKTKKGKGGDKRGTKGKT